MPIRKTAREVAAEVSRPPALLAAERKLARLRERSDTLMDQLHTVRSAWEPNEHRFDVERTARAIEADRREVEHELAGLRRGEYASANRGYVTALREALSPLRRHGEEQVRAGLDLMLRGWAVLDEVDAELRRAGGYGAVRAHLTLEQLSMILARPLEQAGIGPVLEEKHAAD